MAGCTADPGAEPGPFGENPPTAENPHAVPVEQALEELQSVLEEIDTPAEDGAVTRSEATADVEDLLYIVNFENEAAMPFWGPTTGWSRSMRSSMKEASRPKSSGMP